MSDEKEKSSVNAKENLFVMTSTYVVNMYCWLKENGITIWIDGGWGIDALHGKQTREHQDLDIAVHHKDNAKLRRLLDSKGYKEEPRFDSSEYMYVMKNDTGMGIDIHVFEYDDNGNNTYGIEYPFGSLTGKGMIDCQEVNCIDSKWMFTFKTSYKPKNKDIHDVQLLSEQFGFELPKKYKRQKATATILHNQ